MHCQTSGQLVQELKVSTMYDCKCLSVYTYIVSVYKKCMFVIDPSYGKRPEEVIRWSMRY